MVRPTLKLRSVSVFSGPDRPHRCSGHQEGPGDAAWGSSPVYAYGGSSASLVAERQRCAHSCTVAFAVRRDPVVGPACASRQICVSLGSSLPDHGVDRGMVVMSDRGWKA